jgi:hypothetical protein
MPKADWVFWLNMTNIALGAVVFLAVLLVVSALVWDLVGKYQKHRDLANLDAELAAIQPDGRFVPGLGITMADGGERIKPAPERPAEKKRSEE